MEKDNPLIMNLNQMKNKSYKGIVKIFNIFHKIMKMNILDNCYLENKTKCNKADNLKILKKID